MSFLMEPVISIVSHLISMQFFCLGQPVLTAFWLEQRIFHNVEIQSVFTSLADDSCFTNYYTFYLSIISKL